MNNLAVDHLTNRLEFDMEQINIREAELQDLDKLLEFEQGIVNTERPYDSTLKEGEIHYYDLAKYITSPLIGVFVAELDSEIIGSGYARIEKSKTYLKHEWYAYLGFMYVTPSHRGKGVNRKIIDALKQWSLAQGVTEMRLEVYANNENAKRAYEKVGFAPHMLEMRMNLEE